jgi:hypothetical protein
MTLWDWLWFIVLALFGFGATLQSIFILHNPILALVALGLTIAFCTEVYCNRGRFG